MSRILLSINPEHVKNILIGKKRFEFRKVRCRSDVNKILIYSTAPVKKVVAEANIEYIIEGDIEEVWNITNEYSGISYDYYASYYEGKNKAIAYKLCNVRKYKEPKSLSEFGIQYAPQSFVYLPSNI
ncbi:hypothetical protein CCDG5_0777 [[Clostridium] cellulosi]|uniref:ASCH domain-containing protein n=1 Tax=[Clostridium] cellulosi TaxID=29343 RepID=A0A078KJV5_9FIRM|nr:hypothetical protein CCDG5_0777 [[Clostridium] cellulosi]